MQHRGFIFSLDAFVAFILVMLTISLLVFTIGTPKAFYPSLEQAHQLAHDTLYVLATTSDNPASGTYLEQVVGGSGQTAKIMKDVAGGWKNGKIGIIPYGFGYTLETYEFPNTDFPNGVWSVKYNSSKDCSSGDDGSDRCGKEFSKLAASSMTFASFYTVPRNSGHSPFCYLSCKGFDPDNPSGNFDSTFCDKTPCDVMISNFNSGSNSIQLVRLTVYA
ncbi:MAG: hypothetical protein NTV88_03450 [Candidatus Micrarchaeota archaeon]|nr:hypothetical protein [Candidatus Micrarchaeota archaeon]